MYKIIGADQKEYGPVSAEQMRQWINEGRVNAQTKVLADGTTEWKPLAEVSEFAEALGISARPSPPASLPQMGMTATGTREAALQAVKGPAIALKVTAVLGFIAVGLGLAINILTLTGVHLGMEQLGDPQVQKLFSTLGGGLGIVQNIIGAAVGIVVFMGASRMQSLQNYQFAVTASILALVPCVSPCCLFGLPFGIWALVVLNKPEVKSWFS